MQDAASTCLRLVKSIDITVDKELVNHLCIYDFAYRKGIRYGTIVIDADTRKTIEIINSRNTDIVDRALKAYSNVTVHKYLSMNEPQVRKMTFRNNYSRFLPIVQNGIHNKVRISEIYRNAVTDGLTCPYVSFLHWMRTVFPEYKIFKGRATRDSRVDSTGYDKTKSVFKSLYSHKLNIYVANPEWGGISKKTGECSEENIQMNKIIRHAFKTM